MIKRFCKIENGKVTNIINAEQSFIDSLADVYVASETAFIGQEYVNGVFVIPAPTVKTLNELKAEKVKFVQDKYEMERTALITVPKEEEKAWGIQQEEYNACIADPTNPGSTIDLSVPTPAIDGLVQGDNAVGGTITKAELVKRIGNNILGMISATAVITGKQHGYERKINACTTVEELEALVL